MDGGMSRLLCGGGGNPQTPSGNHVRSPDTPRKRDQAQTDPRARRARPRTGFVDRGNPVCAEGRSHRAAVSLAVEILFEKLLDCALILGVETYPERRGNPLHFPAPVIQEVGVLDEHARQAARVSLRQQTVFQPQGTRELRRASS